MDQQAKGGRRHRSLISNAKRLTELDRLRWKTVIQMSNSGLSIRLTTAQAAQLLRDASAQQTSAEVVAGLDTPDELLVTARRLMNDERYSRSLARAMMVFASFPGDGQAQSVTDLAERLSMSPSMVHRYITTFAEMGLLERDPASRKYRRPRGTDHREAHEAPRACR
jgi:hypothetical protein